MFNEDLPRYASNPYEISHTSQRKLLAWGMHSISKFKKRLKAMAQSSRKIIGLFKYSHLALCLNIWMLLVTSQQIMFSNYLAPIKFGLTCISHPSIHPSHTDFITITIINFMDWTISILIAGALCFINLMGCTLKFCFEFIYFP